MQQQHEGDQAAIVAALRQIADEIERGDLGRAELCSQLALLIVTPKDGEPNWERLQPTGHLTFTLTAWRWATVEHVNEVIAMPFAQAVR